jgi:hypothetical protein
MVVKQGPRQMTNDLLVTIRTQLLLPSSTGTAEISGI